MSHFSINAIVGKKVDQGKKKPCVTIIKESIYIASCFKIESKQLKTGVKNMA